jgi:protein kinase A
LIKFTTNDKNNQEPRESKEPKDSSETTRKKLSDISNKMRKNSSSNSMSFSINPLKHMGSIGSLLHLHHHHHQSTQQMEYEKKLKEIFEIKKREFEENYNASSMPISAGTNYFEIIKPKEMELHNFSLDRTIGTGSFGRVVIATLKTDPKRRYAIKMLKKDNIVAKKQVEHTINEKKILSSIKFPFIVELAFSFKDNSNLYMVLELVNGGEMFSHLRKLEKYSEEIACFNAAQIVLSFEYLHHLNIIYRDLKPENVLYGEDGYLKITDFGFAKVCNLRTWTLCGTPEYLAPEIILSNGYTRSVDWWALGILIFEMVAGYTPFFSDSQLKIYEKIIACNLRFPAHFSAELKDLLKLLLQVDTSKRLGSLKNGEADIRLHGWFNKINWIGILEKSEKPPFSPNQEFDHYDEEPLYISPTEKYSEEFREF